MNGEKELEVARERVIDAISKNMNLYGVTESIGRLYGALYFQEGPLTLDEMKEELGMSKTSMSTSVRSLVELKMVGKVWKKGVRKDLYQAEPDWYQTFIDFFTIKWRAGISLNISAMQKSLAETQSLLESEDVDTQVKIHAKLDIEKLTAAIDYYEWLNRLVDSFESKEIFEFIPKNADKKTERS
jgi:DNA-binding transcriptional regulator GbsR (MarR family)